MGLFLSKNILVNLICNSSISPVFSKKNGGDFIPMQIENMVSLVSRTGRQFQRYEEGCRQVVGCIPYRYREKQTSSDEELEVLVISSQKGKGMLFPKGGWEMDESIEEAAKRETLEEAGVTGHLETRLGSWRYKSKTQGTVHEGYMFPLLVQQQLEFWPEKSSRKREWVTVSEAREACQNWWMKEALEKLVCQKMQPQPKGEEGEATCT
ncbi:nudix hydrolase 17, mitochondrial [Pyrus x bretschneideri]|uniref:nudix hydrolase 17, mitochondrial n=1 Tax=Pyrus x bretschneideri TaxID=225117 RepID=UPI0005112471|nr:nudix hydrolase 17, mitochondrial [Pyrus x bretschneideri]